jgi:hypothetical protein
VVGREPRAPQVGAPRCTARAADPADLTGGQLTGLLALLAALATLVAAVWWMACAPAL